MVAASFVLEADVPVEAKRLWKASKDTHNLLPKVAPGPAERVKLVKGDGGVGTIRHVKHTPVVAANRNVRFVKEKVEIFDDAKMVYHYSLVKGGVTSIRYTIKYAPNSCGGTRVMYICNYDTLPRVPISVAEVEEIKRKGYAFFDQLKKISSIPLNTVKIKQYVFDKTTRVL